MNISRIRKMSVEGDMSLSALNYLLECKCECEHLDYKLQINFNNDYDALSISKDVVAMKNMGGGYLVIGVEDKTWNVFGINKEIISDTKSLRDKIRKYTGLDLETDIIHHFIYIKNKKHLVAMILVRGPSNRNKLKSPSQTRKSYLAKEEWGIREGEIYIRIGDQTVKLKDLSAFNGYLEDLEYRYREEEIDAINKYPSPFAIESGFYRLLKKEYGDFIGRNDLKEKVYNAVEKDPRIWIVNLYGPGGVGKSALATWVAYQYYETKKFDAILHLSAKDVELSVESGFHYLNPSLISLEDFLDKILCLFELKEFCISTLADKKIYVNEILDEYKCLFILDNMETIRDGRIMEFVRDFPQTSKAKVLLTSRARTSDWEYPIEITEFSNQEIIEFIQAICSEMKIKIIDDQEVIESISRISGGLPLAIRWIIGEYAHTNNMTNILNRVITADSPLLEFSFRNSWNSLDDKAQQALSVLSIIEEPSTFHVWRTVLNWSVENIEKAIKKLEEVTFVTETIDKNTGEKIYASLPITLSFARNELDKFGELASAARIRYQEYKKTLELTSENVEHYEGLFKKFQAVTDIQKQSIILCRMAEGEASSLGYDEAEEFYNKAISIDPTNIYALVSYGKFKAEFFSYEEALQLINKAVKRITKANGFFVYYNLADVYGKKKDWEKKVFFLKEALKYEPSNIMAQHALGVSLGRLQRHKEAIDIFDKIIQLELQKNSPSNSLIYAINTKIFSLKKLNKESAIEAFINEIIHKLNKNENNTYWVEQVTNILLFEDI